MLLPADTNLQNFFLTSTSKCTIGFLEVTCGVTTHEFCEAWLDIGNRDLEYLPPLQKTGSTSCDQFLKGKEEAKKKIAHGMPVFCKVVFGSPGDSPETEGWWLFWQDVPKV